LTDGEVHLKIESEMAKRFRFYSLDQIYLLPPSLNEWLPEGHLARFIAEVTKELDLKPLLSRYENSDGRGLAAYNPVLMLRLLLYGYCTGRRSSRQIETATYDEVPFRYLAGDQHPDHDTIAAFRQQNLQGLGELFAEVLRLCRAAGMVKLGVVAIDGTKMRANADRNRTKRYQWIEEQEAELQKRVEQILTEAERVDAEEDARYGKGGKAEDLPEELATAKKRLEKIRAAKQKLQQEAAERAEAARKKREAEGGKPENKAAQKRYRRAITPVEKANPQHNFTDTDSKIIPNPAGGFLQGYNAQTVVDSAEQVIVAAEVSSEPADQSQLAPMVKAAEQELQTQVTVALADAGYFSIEALQDEALQGKQVLVSPDSRQAIKEGNGRMKHELAEQMRKLLATEEGRRLYRRRSAIIEPVFAYIKHVRGIRQFLMRGLTAVRAEWRLICLTHNLLKLRRFRTAAQTAA
jgi:transposase